jgi:hypothetical protein
LDRPTSRYLQAGSIFTSAGSKGVVDVIVCGSIRTHGGARHQTRCPDNPHTVIPKRSESDRIGSATSIEFVNARLERSFI